MGSPLFDALTALGAQKQYPFHMPGHKFNRDFFVDDLLSYDFTEIDGTDNLHDPTGVILDAQEKTKALFGADHSFFTVNGSTGGLLASILTVCAPGDKIIVARNCHKSVYSGLVLSGAVPIYVYPAVTPEGFCGGIDPLDIAAQLEQHQDDDKLKAVIVTSPTYEGFCSDLKQIAQIVHRHHKILIVDEAHGSHFRFHDAFPVPALDHHADIVIQSWHKTLPALTQSSVLHTKGGRVNLSRLKQMLAIVQTSSPSYILMATMDKLRQTLEEKGHDLFSSYVPMLKQVREAVSGYDTLQLMGTSLQHHHGIHDIDITKLVFSIYADVDGKYVEQKLLKEHSFAIEYSTAHALVMLTSVADTKAGFNRLQEGIVSCARQLPYRKRPPDTTALCPVSSDSIISLRDAIYNETTEICLAKSVGHICGEWVIPYPPGIPLVLPGERITAEIVDQITYLLYHHVRVMGIFNQTIKIINQ